MGLGLWSPEDLDESDVVISGARDGEIGDRGADLVRVRVRGRGRLRGRGRGRGRGRVRVRARVRVRVRRSRSRPLSRRSSSTSSGGRRLLSIAILSTVKQVPRAWSRGRAILTYLVCISTWHRVKAVREYLEAHLECEDKSEAHVEGEEHLGRDRG